MNRKVALALGTMALWATVAGAANWPLFRGNATQTGSADSELPSPLQILWQFKAKAIEGTAAIVDGVVYVGSDDEFLYALNLSNGEVKWRYKTDGAIRNGVAVSGGCVYVGDEYGKFHCIDAKTGAKKWLFDTEASITSAANFEGEKVLFGAGNELLYCLDKDKGGTPLWTFKVPGGQVKGSPAVIAGKTFAAGCDSMLHVIDVQNGKEVRNVDLGSQVGASAAVVGEMFYVGTMTSNFVQAVDWKAGKVVWSYEAKKRQQPFESGVAATNELVLAGSRDRSLHAMDRKTGKGRWVFTTEGTVSSSPVVVGQRVYFGSNDSKLYVVDIATGKQVQALQLGNKGILASPAVSDNRLVIGNIDGVLYCLGSKTAN